MASIEEKNKYITIANRAAERAGVGDFIPRRTLEGLAWVATDDTRIVEAPLPTSPHRLYIFLHEMGHHFHRHPDKGDTVPDALEEYEAETFALDTLRANDIPVSRKMWEGAAYNMQQAIKRTKRQGVGVPDVAMNFQKDATRKAKGNV